MRGFARTIDERVPSTAGRACGRAERYEATNGAEAGDPRGRPIIVVDPIGLEAIGRLGSQAFAGSIRSTKSARQAGASNGLAKYSVIRDTLPSRISPIPT